MKKLSVFLFTIALLIVNYCGYGQQATVSSRLLPDEEVEAMFTEALLVKLSIDYAIYRVYEYQDKGGEHFIIMTEDATNCAEEIDFKECFRTIKAYCFDKKGENWTLNWTMNDFILPNGNDVSVEYSIWFWTKYFKLDDFDKDGYIDPIMVYGTAGRNSMSDGRIKILVYYHGKKRGVRHQNSTMDGERHTKVDAEFYALPSGIQKRVQEIMNHIDANGHGIFPYGWESAMQKKKLSFDEN